MLTQSPSHSFENSDNSKSTQIIVIHYFETKKKTYLLKQAFPISPLVNMLLLVINFTDYFSIIILLCIFLIVVF